MCDYYYYVYYYNRSYKLVREIVAAPTAIQAMRCVRRLPDCLYVERAEIHNRVPVKEGQA